MHGSSSRRKRVYGSASRVDSGRLVLCLNTLVPGYGGR